MARLLLILLAALVLTGGLFAGLVFALDRLGWYPIYDASHHVIRENVLELVKSLPGLLAFAASLAGAFVAIRLVALQEATRADLERFKADLTGEFDMLRMQVGLSIHDAERINEHLSHALKAAANYLTLLEQLGEGIFNADAVRVAELEAKHTAAVLDGSSEARAAYDRFLQEGTTIAESAEGLVTWWRRKQVWTEGGRRLSDRFIELQTCIEIARFTLPSHAPRKAASPPETRPEAQPPEAQAS